MSNQDLLRAEREHSHCIARWEEIRQTDPTRLHSITQHDLEAHLPSPVRCMWCGSLGRESWQEHLETPRHKDNRKAGLDVDHR